MKKYLIITILALVTLPFYVADSQSGAIGQTTITNPINGGSLVLPVSDINQNTGLPEGISEQVTLRTTPLYPKPGDTITLTVESFSTNLNAARTTWYQNGSVIKDGKGIIKQSVTLPTSGSPTTIRVVIVKENGGTIEKSISIEPAKISLVYEALTYTPPFYKGKKVFSHQAGLRVIAIPEFNTGNSTYNPQDLIYKWEKNGTVVQEYSGIGQNVLVLEAGLIPRPINITVTVSAPNSSLLAREILVVDIHNTEVNLYEDNPVLGTIYTQSLSSGIYELNRDEINVLAEPFYFSANSPQVLEYEWKLNGNSIPLNTNQNNVVFRNSENITGTAFISSEARNVDKLFQTAQSSLNMQITEEGAVNENAPAFDF